MDILPPLKRCSKCGIEKPSTSKYFSKHKLGKGGLSSACKDCERERLKSYYVENSERQKKQQVERYNKDIEKSRERAKLYAVNSREKKAAKMRKYYAANPEAAKKRLADYIKKNPEWAKVRDAKRNARKRSLPDNFTVDDWKHALAYFNGCCAACGRPQGLWHTLAADHWIPLSSPDCPGTIPVNIVPLCHGIGGCNNTKHNKNPEQWLNEQFGTRKAKQIMRRIQNYFDSFSEK